MTSRRIVRQRPEEIGIVPLTPTAITAAREAGADFRIVPCAQVAGSGYVHALKGLLRDVRFVAAGGITRQTAGEFMCAGTADFNQSR